MLLYLQIRLDYKKAVSSTRKKKKAAQNFVHTLSPKLLEMHRQKHYLQKCSVLLKIFRKFKKITAKSLSVKKIITTGHIILNRPKNELSALKAVLENCYKNFINLI